MILVGPVRSALAGALLGAVAAAVALAGQSAAGKVPGEALVLSADVPPVLLPRAVLAQLAMGESPLAVELEAARARWAAVGPTRYRLRVTHGVFGSVEHVTVDVDGDAVVVVAAECDGWATVCRLLPAARYTVTGIFDTIARALGRQLDRPPGEQGSLRVSAAFAPGDGLPLFLDTYALLVTDTDERWQVDSLEALAD
ncbi:MAG: hypothetical protein IT304_05015 [Dehalococcoidia bacterium]|nr:hypothetical protein [Dehalococcoidia bacterium]